MQKNDIGLQTLNEFLYHYFLIYFVANFELTTVNVIIFESRILRCFFIPSLRRAFHYNTHPRFSVIFANDTVII